MKKYQVFVSMWYNVSAHELIDCIERGYPKEHKTSRCPIVEAATEEEAKTKVIQMLCGRNTGFGQAPLFMPGSYRIQGVEEVPDLPDPLDELNAMYGIEE